MYKKSVMHVQSCCSANLNLLLFFCHCRCRRRCRRLRRRRRRRRRLRRRRCLSSLFTCAAPDFFSSSVSSSCLRVILVLIALPSTSTMSPVSPHVRESKTVLDSGLNFVGSGFPVLLSTSFSVELGFRILIVSRITDSYSCIRDSKTQDS